MKTIVLKSLSASQIKKLTKRPSVNLEKIFPRVRNILNKVKIQGDVAVRKYTQMFDGVELKGFEVGKREYREALGKIKPEVKRALEVAAANIKKFHQRQLKREDLIETMKGIRCWRETRPIEKVGIYIPKGLVSTVLMLGIPARIAMPASNALRSNAGRQSVAGGPAAIAGCREIIMCTPADEQGRIAKEMVMAAKIAGVTKIFKIGGAQAVGAMAYGTETVPKVDKIFGPGNQYVTAAKLLVSIDLEGTAIDLPAGPSEVLVVADEKANPSFVAADLLSQAEHGIDSQVVLLTTSAALAKMVKKELSTQVRELPPMRRKFASATLKNSLCIIIGSLDEAIAFSNLYSPEHLILNFENPKKYISKIKNAGSVFVGGCSPESVGDYASGTNHVLPTSGLARSYSGVSVDSFVKKITFQQINKKGLQNIASVVETLADVEQMPAHKQAVSIRLNMKE